MKQPTKAELKDRIAELEAEKAARAGQIQLIEHKWSEDIVAELEARASRATIAAYACLAVIAILVLWEVIL